MKMKVGIVTMISDNYGNRLQNYALQEVLTEIGNAVETLNNPWNDKDNYYRELIVTTIKKAFFYITKKPIRYERKIRFEQFNRKNIIFSKFWLNKESDKEKAISFYDIFICGSDQVWNSEAKEITGKYFADFADRNKRASYATSFGIERVIPDRREEFSDYLSGMKYISVREQLGVEIVKELTGKEASCHVDPTLLLSAAKWDKIASKIFVPKNKYIFCYFLGKPSDVLLNEIEKYKKSNDINVLTICNELNSMYNNVGPDYFISLIKNAKFVLTDSFHGTVFSIIYNKPFYTFTRNGVKESMDSRVTSLLKLLKLEDRFEPDYLKEKNIYNIDFIKSKSILNVEREKAINYLRMITKENNYS